MPTPTYTLIDSVTLGSSASSINFTGIPTDGTYRDLQVVLSGGRDNSGNQNAAVLFNSNTSSVYSIVRMSGDGTNADSVSSTNFPRITLGFGSSSGTDMGGLLVMSILDYAQTNKHKSGLLSLIDPSVANLERCAFRWGDTSAINAVNIISPFGGAYASGTKAYLYGIAG
jgi:hypothetical protein